VRQAELRRQLVGCTRTRVSARLGALGDLRVIRGEDFVGHDRRRLGLRHRWVGARPAARAAGLGGEDDTAREPVAGAGTGYL
jgi:hypothetical protein